MSNTDSEIPAFLRKTFTTPTGVTLPAIGQGTNTAPVAAPVETNMETVKETVVVTVQAPKPAKTAKAIKVVDPHRKPGARGATSKFAKLESGETMALGLDDMGNPKSATFNVSILGHGPLKLFVKDGQLWVEKL